MKNDCITPGRVESVTISCAVAGAPPNSNSNAASPDKNARHPAAKFICVV
jgi:hypothetical protein